jgi:hypothetical protein
MQEIWNEDRLLQNENYENSREKKRKLVIRGRIDLAKKAFINMRELMTRNFTKNVRKKLLKSFVWSIALHGAETWSMGKEY